MNVPTTFIIESLDKSVLPTNLLVILLKNIFRFGRNGITTADDQVHLSYSPKRETVERKLKQLPVKYLRVFADNEEEFKLLCTGLQQFKDLNFQLEDEELLSPTTKNKEPLPSSSSLPSSMGPPLKKRK
nr:unnamed protein product [Callosobruchus analis]